MSKKITDENGINYEIDENNFTAKIVQSLRTMSHIFIPRFINFQSKEYIITKISENSFSENRSIQIINITEDSAIISIEKNSFSYSSLKQINIPASVQELEEGWCNNTSNLKKVTISPNNPNFQYADDNQQIIIGKSDKNFDVLFFASRKIKQATIPDNIKRISSYAFESCFKLESIEISEDSKLQFIGKNAFSYSSIKSLFIPSDVCELQEGWCRHLPHLTNVKISPKNENFKFSDGNENLIVGKSDKNKEKYDVLVFATRDIKRADIPNDIVYINQSSFEHCRDCGYINIAEDSEIAKIGKNAFSSTLIEYLFIPSTVEHLEEGWCKNTNFLKNILIYTNNPYLKYADRKRQIIIGKSDRSKKTFDTLIFASRNIANIVIPSTITHISSYAFENCKYITSIEFHSKIKSIGKRAFAYTNLKTVFIPHGIEMIGASAFYSCTELNNVVFEEGSKLKAISSCLFHSCRRLEKVIIPEKCQLQTIQRRAFYFTYVDKIFIPASVKEFEFCFDESPTLRKLSLSLDNRYYKYMDENRQVIVGKSDSNTENYDVIVLAQRDNIQHVTIPNNIKFINPFTFASCYQLTTLDISEDSELQFITRNALFSSSITSLFIPAKLKEIEEGWCMSLNSLVNVSISPNNRHFSFVDKENKLIASKSDFKNNELFDFLIFASRDINHAFIPSCIKHICSYSFGHCKKLIKIDFAEDSNLESIGDNVFEQSGISRITIPRSVYKLSRYSFISCSNLKTIEFLGERLDSCFHFTKTNFKLILVSFPNLNELAVDDSSFSSDVSLFICAGAQIIS